MRFLLVALSAALTFTGQLYAQSVSEIRDELFYKDFDEEQTLSFHEKLESVEDPTPVVKAYRGVAEALVAKVAWNPVIKIGHLKSSREFLNNAVKEDPTNLEIRFLRFSTQYAIPAILGFSHDLQEDKDAIMAYLQDISGLALDRDLLLFIIDFMGTTKLCSEEELAVIRTQLSEAAG